MNDYYFLCVKHIYNMVLIYISSCTIFIFLFYILGRQKLSKTSVIQVFSFSYMHYLINKPYIFLIFMYPKFLFIKLTLKSVNIYVKNVCYIHICDNMVFAEFIMFWYSNASASYRSCQTYRTRKMYRYLSLEILNLEKSFWQQVTIANQSL